MRRVLPVVVVLIAAAAFAAPATGAIFIHLATTRVHRGDMIRVTGNAGHLALYALPTRRLPCARYGTCPDPIHRAKPPSGLPFVFLGLLPGTGAVRLPRGLGAGRYFVFVWCPACGGSLIVAGNAPSGQPQTLRVLR